MEQGPKQQSIGWASSSPAMSSNSGGQQTQLLQRLAALDVAAAVAPTWEERLLRPRFGLCQMVAPAPVAALAAVGRKTDKTLSHIVRRNPSRVSHAGRTRMAVVLQYVSFRLQRHRRDWLQMYCGARQATSPSLACHSRRPAMTRMQQQTQAGPAGARRAAAGTAQSLRLTWRRKRRRVIGRWQWDEERYQEGALCPSPSAHACAQTGRAVALSMHPSFLCA